MLYVCHIICPNRALNFRKLKQKHENAITKSSTWNHRQPHYNQLHNHLHHSRNPNWNPSHNPNPHYSPIPPHPHHIFANTRQPRTQYEPRIAEHNHTPKVSMAPMVFLPCSDPEPQTQQPPRLSSTQRPVPQSASSMPSPSAALRALQPRSLAPEQTAGAASFGGHWLGGGAEPRGEEEAAYSG